VVDFRLAPDDLAYARRLRRRRHPRRCGVRRSRGRSAPPTSHPSAGAVAGRRHPAGDAEIVEAVANCFLQLYRSGTSGWPEGALLTDRAGRGRRARLRHEREHRPRGHDAPAPPLIRPGSFPTAVGASPTTTAPTLSRHAPCPTTSPAGSSSGNCGRRVQPDR
jgi:hypothetical protein